MATWVTPIPPNDVVAGDPGHPGMHNELSDNITEIRTNVDLVEADTLTGTPTAIADVAVPFADLTAAATAYNALLAELRDRGVLAP